MSDDHVIDVRQIAQYPLASASAPTDRWLLQQLGVGGPYASIAPANAVGSALEMGGYLRLAPNAGGVAWNGVALTSDGISITSTADLHVPSLHAVGDIFVNGEALASQDWVQGIFDVLLEDVVFTFNGRKGIVQLNEDDILRAGGILQWNPHFRGVVLVPTVWDFRQNDDTAASCAWVQFVIENLLCSGSVVQSFNGRGGAVVLTADDITMAATIPGAYPRANSPPIGDASSRIATTMFVDQSMLELQRWVEDAIEAGLAPDLSPYAKLNSPAFTGIPTAPTANAGTTTGQLATTAFVMNAVAAATAGVSSFNTRTGAVTLTTADVTSAGGAPISSPTFTGTPQAPTAANATNTQQIATTAFVHSLLSATNLVASFNTRTGAVVLTTADITGAGGAPLTSPALGGTPTAPTATAGTNTTQIATTAFVQAALGGVTGAVSSWNGRTGAVTLQANDVSAVGGALLASPSFTGVPLAPTATAGTNTNQIATTAFVMANSSIGGVSSFNGRTGAITLISGDITAAGGAPISSPALTGTPTAPTAAQTVNDQTIATTAYVRTAIASATGVASFNTRTGAVTLNGTDITNAGGALTTGPTFTGIPAAPTASPGTNTTQLATTAFVQAAVGAAVTSFNGRSGTVLLIANDITLAGGALLASPTFTGTPNAPTPTTGTNNTQIATTAFVNAAITAAGGVTYKQADTAPVPVTNFWFDSLNGQLYVRYVDPSTSAQSWVVANSYTPPPPQPLASGTRVLIQSQTVSAAVASVDFTTGIDGTYDEYEIDFYGVTIGTNGSWLALRVFSAGAWDAGATSYWYGWAINYGSTAAPSYDGNNAATIKMSQLNSGGGAAGLWPMGGKVKFWQPSLTGNSKQFLFDLVGYSSGSSNAPYRNVGVGHYGSALASAGAAFSGVRFLLNAGNITAGTFRLSGIVR